MSHRLPLWSCSILPWCCSSSRPSLAWTFTAERTSDWMSSAACIAPALTVLSTCLLTSCRMPVNSHTLLQLPQPTSTRQGQPSPPALTSLPPCKRSPSVMQPDSTLSPYFHLHLRYPPALPQLLSAQILKHKVRKG